MVEETAKVIAVEGDSAILEAARKSVCGNCEVRHGCGTGALSRFLGKRVARVHAVNRAGAGVGDEVIVSIDERALIRGSLAIYLVPLLAMIGAAMGVEMLAQLKGMRIPEWAALFAGVLGFLVSLFWLRGYSRRIRYDQRYQPVVTKITRTGNAFPVAVSH